MKTRDETEKEIHNININHSNMYRSKDPESKESTSERVSAEPFLVTSTELDLNSSSSTDLRDPCMLDSR